MDSKNILSRNEWNDYLERCLAVLRKHGFAPPKELTERATLEEYVHKLAKSPFAPSLPTSWVFPWCKARVSDIFEHCLGGMLFFGVEKMENPTLPSPSCGHRGEVSIEKMRVMTWECAMIATEYQGTVGVYNESLNSLWYGIEKLLEEMGYKTPHTALHVPRWSEQPEWKAFEEACKKKK